MRLKEWQKITLIILTIFIVVGFLFSRFIGMFSAPQVNVSNGSYLNLLIANTVDERSDVDPIMEAFGESTPASLQKMLRAIRRAKSDDRIKGILLRPVFAGMGWGKINEVYNALNDFRSSGKVVYAYLEAASNKEYYLASAADTIIGVSTGLLFVNGFLSQPMFLKGTLDKIGVEADFVAIGKYKNAPDQYRRKSMSDGQREVINAILDEFYARFVDTLATAREISKDRIRQYIDQGFFSMLNANKMGLVDTLMYYQQFQDHIEENDGRKMSLFSVGKSLEAPGSQIAPIADGKIAVIYGVGTIVVGGTGQNGVNGLITSAGMAKNIRDASDDDDVKAIILRINSPGGSATASDIIWNEVIRARDKKPVIVSVSDVAASGGYYISMAAHKIVAHPNSIVGSIGIFAGKFSWNKLYDKIGLTVEQIDRGRNADLFSTTGTFNNEQRALLHNFIDEFYQDFITKAAAGRHTTPEAIDAVGQGRVWTGTQGLTVGLVDTLGDFSTAVAIAKKMADIPEDHLVRLISMPEMKTYLERLFDTQSKSPRLEDALPEVRLLPPMLRSIVNAMPHFRSGEPLLLHTIELEGSQNRTLLPPVGH